MFNTLAKANEAALSSGWHVLAWTPLPWRLVTWAKGNIMWRKLIHLHRREVSGQHAGDRHLLSRRPGEYLSAFTMLPLTYCKIVIVKCDKVLAALWVIIIIPNSTVRKVYDSEHSKDGFYLPFLNAAAVRDIHICTHSTSCQTAHTCFCDLFRFHWRNPQHYWQGCLYK